MSQFIKTTLSILIVCFLSHLVYANMASPIMEGTKGSTAFLNKNVEILDEIINITLAKDFKSARYDIRYHINTNKNGEQIPMIFQAEDYQSGFKIFVDGKPVGIEALPPNFYPTTSDTQDFSHVIESGGEVTIWWTESSGIVEELSNLKYFKLDLSEGEHIVEVEYVSEPWTDRSNWVKEYSFRYALSPAKHWKSFGHLDIIIDSKNLTEEFTTNLGIPKFNQDGIAKWRFNEIPKNIIEIKYIPKISGVAELAISLGPFGIALIVSFFLIVMHLVLIKNHRKNSTSRYSPIVIIGGILIPIIFFLIWCWSFEWIDMLIGTEAGSYHGYLFLMFFFCPFVILIYSIIMWKYDSFLKLKKIKSK